MKKFALITIVSLFIMNVSSAQSFNADSAWTKLPPDSVDNFHSIWFSDSLMGFVAGETGLQATFDGGESWTFLENDFDGDYRILDFFAYAPSNMWVIVEEDTLNNAAGRDNKAYHLYHSGDTAMSWQKTYTNTNTYLRGVFFINDTSGWMYGSNYSILATSDGGNNWSLQYSDTLSGFIKDCFFLNELSGFAVGDNSTILQTNDAGESWTSLGELPAYSSLNTVFALDEDNIRAAGSLGRIFLTGDGGNNWTTKQLGIGDEVFDLYFKNDMTGWAAAAAGKLFYTATANSLWDTTEFNTQNLRDIFFLDENHAWIAGSQGLILKTTDGGGEVSINETGLPQWLNKPYPNPVKDKVYLEFTESSQEVYLRLYDIQGRCIQKQKLNKGTQQFSLEFGSLSNGVYFLELTSSDKTAVHKIIKK